MLQSPSANLGCWRPRVTKERPYQQDFSTMKYTQPPPPQVKLKAIRSNGEAAKSECHAARPLQHPKQEPSTSSCTWTPLLLKTWALPPWVLPVSMCQAWNIFWNSSRLSFLSMRQCSLNRQHQQPWAFYTALTTARNSSSLGELPCWLTLQEALQGTKKSHNSSQENGKLWKTCIRRLPA